MPGQTRQLEKLIALEKRWPGFMKGEDHPSNAVERLGFAQIAFNHKRLALAASLWDDALHSDPKQLADLPAGHAYHAACAAVLAAAGQGQHAGPDDATRTRLRSLALAWLKQELKALSESLARRPQQDRSAVARTLEHWKLNPDLASVRDAVALAKLPDQEQQSWRSSGPA